MWFYRRLLTVKWTEKRTNTSILEELSAKREILDTIHKRRLKYIGHAIRNKNTNLMATVLQGKVDAKRKKGRPSVTYMENISRVCNLNLQQMTERCQDRET